MSDILYTPNGHPYVEPDDGQSGPIRVRPRVRDLVSDVAPAEAVNPLEFLYGSPQATGEQTTRGPGGALRDILQSAGRDATNFVTSLATAPYRAIQAEMERTIGEPLSSDDRGLDAASEAAQFAVGGGMPFAARGALGSAGGRLGAPAKVGPFYSAVEAAIAEAPQAKMTPEQWSGYLRNRPGVKAEELDFMGLGDGALHPAEWKTGQPVTREQMLEHADSRGVKLKEIEKSEADGQVTEKQQRRAEEAAMDDMIEAHPDVNPMEMLEDPTRAAKYQELTHGYIEELGGDVAGTKFHEYQLPGGENYRELLLTTPEKWMTPGRRDAPSQAARDKMFVSSHWDEPNVLVHMRMNDRYLGGSSRTEPVVEKHFPNEWGVKDKNGNLVITVGSRETADSIVGSPANVSKGYTVEPHAYSQYFVGNNQFPTRDVADQFVRNKASGLKSLHLEEVQSDWHQQGRKQGYKSDEQASLQRVIDAEKKMNIASQKAAAKQTDTETPVHLRVKEALSDPDYMTAAAKYMEENERHTKEFSNGSRVPDAPFKSTWADLALKRAITKAAEEGYDAISWTPGAQQAERYDLSKRVSEIGAVKNDDGTFHLRHKPVNESATRTLADKIPANKIADYVGKDLAEKIIKETPDKAGNWKIFSGLDLKVGGEGMKAFYDKMLVDKANALGKKFGAKVEWQELPNQFNIGETPKNLKRLPEYKKFQVIDGHDNHVQFFDTKEAAQKWIGDNAVKVPVLRLNDKLRDTASRKGMPLFSSGLPFKFTPVDHDPFNDREPLQ